MFTLVLRMGFSVNDDAAALELYVAKDALDGFVLPASLKKTLRGAEYDAARFARMARHAGRLEPL